MICTPALERADGELASAPAFCLARLLSLRWDCKIGTSAAKAARVLGGLCRG